MTRFLLRSVPASSATATFVAALGPSSVSAAPSAEVAKRCLHFSYFRTRSNTRERCI